MALHRQESRFYEATDATPIESSMGRRCLSNDGATSQSYTPLAMSEEQPPPPAVPQREPQPETRAKSLAGELLAANHELRASVVSNVLTKGLIGLGLGVGLALFAFKSSLTRRRWLFILPLGKVAPVMFTTGFGLGMGYSEGSQMVRNFHEDMRRKAIFPDQHQKTPPGL